MRRDERSRALAELAFLAMVSDLVEERSGEASAGSAALALSTSLCGPGVLCRLAEVAIEVGCATDRLRGGDEVVGAQAGVRAQAGAELPGFVLVALVCRISPGRFDREAFERAFAAVDASPGWPRVGPVWRGPLLDELGSGEDQLNVTMGGDAWWDLLCAAVLGIDGERGWVLEEMWRTEVTERAQVALGLAAAWVAVELSGAAASAVCSMCEHGEDPVALAEVVLCAIG